MMPQFDFNMFNYIAASTSDFGRPNRGRRERITYNRKQLDILEDTFRETHYPDVYRREQLSALLGIPEGRVQVWFKNRRARYRQSQRLPGAMYQRNPPEFGNGKLKTSKPSSPEIHPSPPIPSNASTDSSSTQSAASISPSLPILAPKAENYSDIPLDAPQFQQLKDFEKSIYSMSLQANGNFWPTASNWQTNPYYPMAYPQPYVPQMASNPATIYGYPTPQTMPQQYQNFYQTPAFTNPYPDKDHDLTKPKE